jgi:hypothetical protein
MSGNFHTDDQNFSFTLPRLDENTWFSVTKPETSLRFFYYAVGASLVIHFAVALWLPFKRIVALPTDSPQTIHLELQYATPLEAAPAEAPPVPADVPAPVHEDIPEAVKEEEQTVEDNSLSAAAEPEVLDKADIQAAIQPINGTADMKMDSLRRENFGDVFDPRLRARLQNNRTAIRTEQSSRGVTMTNIYGETLVDVGDGSCLMGREARAGEPTNWYMTKCSNYKDEGETMMERVNRAVQKRR